MLLQVATQNLSTVLQIVVSITIILLNLGVIFSAWVNVKSKQKEQDIEIQNIKLNIIKLESNNEKYFDHMEQSMNVNKNLLMELHSKFEKHLGYHEAIDDK